MRAGDADYSRAVHRFLDVCRFHFPFDILLIGACRR